MTTPHLPADKLVPLLLVVAATLSACRHADAPPPEAAPLPPPMSERIRGLPSLPYPLAQASPAFQRLFEGVDVALEDRIPLPDVRDETAYRAYVDGPLSAWLGRRAEALDDAETRLGSIRTEGMTPEATVGDTLVAYLYESTARDVIANDVPSGNPARASAIRDAWRESMRPMLDRARTYFLHCVEATRTPPIELSAWAAVCRDHAASTLPGNEPAPNASPQERP